MSYDAGFMSHIIKEINDLSSGFRIEKIYQNARDEVVFVMRSQGGMLRLLADASSSTPHLCLTETKSENPAAAPMFCMLLRKHLTGARLISCTQLGFERAACLEFDTRDEMGYGAKKRVIIETMGRFSNIILTDGDMKIIGLLRSVDFTTSEKRQLLAGMLYTPPPKQDKASPVDVTREQFMKMCASCDSDRCVDKFIMSAFAGYSAVVAREIAFRAAGSVSSTMNDAKERLCDVFFDVADKVKKASGTPCIVTRDGRPAEFSFIELTQYGSQGRESEKSFSSLCDRFYMERAASDRTRQRSADIHRLLASAEGRVEKKLHLQRCELEECANGEKFKLYGDLITANIYRLSRGMTECTLENYYDSDNTPVAIQLDSRLTPSANAQRYYKKYAKTKSAREHLTKQIAISEAQLYYIGSVFDSLSRAETAQELDSIRDELYQSGYASRMKNYERKKKLAPQYARFKTSGGYAVLCGKNNTANDYLTFHVAAKNDWWFHIKNMPGSHVIMRSGDDEPSAADFTEAAMIAAYYSKSKTAPGAAVDYIKARYVKKPAMSAPGYVIYHTNFTAYVTPDERLINEMKARASSGESAE